MSDLQIQQREEIDDSDYGYRKYPVCKACKTSKNLICTAGYYYCYNCQGDEVVFPTIPEWIAKEVKLQNQIKI